MGTFSGPKSLAVQIFFNALWVGLTNPRDISDSFNENPLTFVIRGEPFAFVFSMLVYHNTFVLN